MGSGNAALSEPAVTVTLRLAHSPLAGISRLQPQQAPPRNVVPMPDNAPAEPLVEAAGADHS